MAQNAAMLVRADKHAIESRTVYLLGAYSDFTASLRSKREQLASPFHCGFLKGYLQNKVTL